MVNHLSKLLSRQYAFILVASGMRDDGELFPLKVYKEAILKEDIMLQNTMLHLDHYLGNHRPFFEQICGQEISQ